MSPRKKKNRPLAKQKSKSKCHRPPGIIHVYQSVRNPVKHVRFCFDTDDFKLFLTEMLSLSLPSSFQAIFIRQCKLHFTDGLPFTKSRMSVPDIPSLIRHILMRGFSSLQTSLSIPSSHKWVIQDAVPLQMTHELHGAFLVDCVLSRSHQKPRIPEQTPYYEVVHRIRTSKELCSDQHDDIFRTTIIIFPYSSVFWTSAFISDPTKLFSEVESGIGCSITTSPLVPLPLSWLRLVYKTGLPAKGSFIKTINHVWTVNYTTSSEIPKTVHSIQFHDADPDTPLLPPDCFGKNVIQDVQDRRLFYRALFAQSASNRHGCRRYVTQALYQNLQDSTAYVHDPRAHERNCYVFQTTTLDPDKRPCGQSNIVVSYIPSSNKLYQDLVHASLDVVADKTFASGGNARRKAGDNGQMCGFGVMFNRYQQKITCIPVSDSNMDLKSSVKTVCMGIADLADIQYPGVRPLFRSLSNQASIEIPDELGGNNGFSSNIAISVDLENAAHVDINDASVCLVAFAETLPHSTSDWFFVFPDILLRVDGRSYNGLVVKLTHGVTILFDGRVIRHCTSRHNRSKSTKGEEGHTVGWFFGTSLPALVSGGLPAKLTP